MNVRAVKRFVAPIALVLVCGLFVYFWRTHPSFWWQLKQVQPAVLVLLMLLYACVIASLAYIQKVSLRMCRIIIPTKEILLLTGYSAIANFFMPLQSGPGVRAAYLKKKHSLGLKRYGFVTLLYYGLFGLFSCLCIAVGMSFYVFVGLAAAGLAVGYWLITQKKLQVRWQQLCVLGVATAAQVLLTVVLYYVELRSSGGRVSVAQAFMYTGVANLAMYVSLTPGALGFREMFLVFSRTKLGISTDHILSASVLDRAAYVLFLGLLFLLGTILHVKDRIAVGAEKS